MLDVGTMDVDFFISENNYEKWCNIISRYHDGDSDSKGKVERHLIKSLAT